MAEMEESYFIVDENNQVCLTSFRTYAEAEAFLNSDEFTEEEREHCRIEVY